MLAIRAEQAEEFDFDGFVLPSLRDWMLFLFNRVICSRITRDFLCSGGGGGGGGEEFSEQGGQNSQDSSGDPLSSSTPPAGFFFQGRVHTAADGDFLHTIRSFHSIQSFHSIFQDFLLLSLPSSATIGWKGWEGCPRVEPFTAQSCEHFPEQSFPSLRDVREGLQRVSTQDFRREGVIWIQVLSYPEEEVEACLQDMLGES